MKNITKLVFAMIFAAILFTACSSEDNPIAPDSGTGGNPDPDPIIIKTPRYMRVESISVRSFPKNKSNGDDWDWNPLSSTERKPDLEVVLQHPVIICPLIGQTRERMPPTQTPMFLLSQRHPMTVNFLTQYLMDKHGRLTLLIMILVVMIRWVQLQLNHLQFITKTMPQILTKPLQTEILKSD